MTIAMGVDVGGTKIAAGLVDESGEILQMTRVETPATDVSQIAEAIGGACRELASCHEVEAIGIGAAGFVDAKRENVVFSANLAWREEPLARRVAEATGIDHVVVENDANAAAWGEFRFGAATNVPSAVVVTIGTGVGGGIILDGELLRGRNGFAAEIGHMSMVPGGLRCGCGERGCWEQYASGRALVRVAREAAEKAPVASQKMLELAGGKIENITGPIVTQAAQAGDEMALDCFNEVACWIGQGLADLSTLLDPDMFVLAGGVSEAGELLRAPVERCFNDKLSARSLRTPSPIVTATLGNDAGLIGAADLARR